MKFAIHQANRKQLTRVVSLAKRSEARNIGQSIGRKQQLDSIFFLMFENTQKQFLLKFSFCQRPKRKSLHSAKASRNPTENDKETK